MTRAARKARSNRILSDLDQLHGEWQSSAVSDPNDYEATARRERFKLLEAETAVLRLLQAESRLLQQVLLGVGGFVSGSLATLLLKHWLVG